MTPLLHVPWQPAADARSSLPRSWLPGRGYSRSPPRCCPRHPHPAGRDPPGPHRCRASPAGPTPSQKVSWKFRLVRYNPFSKPQLLIAIQHFTTFATWTTHKSFSKEAKSRFAFFPQTVARPIKEIQKTVKTNTTQARVMISILDHHMCLSAKR